MFQFPRLALLLPRVTAITDGRVSPFGHPGIVACVPLPLAYRSLPRPSSPPCTQASPTYLLSLDQISVSKQNNIKKTYNAQSTNESIFARFPTRLNESERDEIESVLILDARDLIRSHASNPTITTNIRCQTACSNVPDCLGYEGAKFARQASTPVERKRIGVEIKDDARRANYVRTFDLRLAAFGCYTGCLLVAPLRR